MVGKGVSVVGLSLSWIVGSCDGFPEGSCVGISSFISMGLGAWVAFIGAAVGKLVFVPVGNAVAVVGDNVDGERDGAEEMVGTLDGESD